MVAAAFRTFSMRLPVPSIQVTTILEKINIFESFQALRNVQITDKIFNSHDPI